MSILQAGFVVASYSCCCRPLLSLVVPYCLSPPFPGSSQFHHAPGLLKMTFRESLTKRFAGTYLAAPKYAEGNPFYRQKQLLGMMDPTSQDRAVGIIWIWLLDDGCEDSKGTFFLEDLPEIRSEINFVVPGELRDVLVQFDQLLSL